jgi:ferredoxin-NADP reductase
MKLTYKNTNSNVDNVKTYVFQTSEKTSWKPGQFIHYTFPHNDADDRGDERWFTISSAPFEGDIWLTTRVLGKDGSTFKQQLDALSDGETIEVDSPSGDFSVADATKSYVFVAGGIGVTPYRSILKQLDKDGKHINVELLYANRDDQSIIFKDELEALAEKHPNFNITYFIGDNLIDQKALEEYGKRLEDPYYFISGPEPMVEAFETTLSNMGVDESLIKFDYFPGYENY